VRVALHGQAAWSLLDAGRGPSAAARHLLETHPEGDPWVVRQLRAAARETLRAGAPEAARSYLARALREPPPPQERAAVLYELGCSSQLLEPATTVNHLRAALEEPIADPALHDGIVFRLSQSLAHSDRLSEAAEVVGRAARTATSARTRLRMQAEQFMWDAFRADEPDSPSRSRRLTRLADRLTGRGLHREAAAELAAVGRRLDPRGMRNPAWCPWQLHLALAESYDDPGRAEATVLDAVTRARQFGAPSTVGHALRVAAEVIGGAEGLKLLEEAVARLETSPAAHELARALIAHGSALRMTGAHAEAAGRLRRGLAGALESGADGLADRARRELALLAPAGPPEGRASRAPEDRKA
jgi:hypothetical protein